MPRKSPRSRRKPDPAPRLPGRERPRTSPGKGRSAAKKRAKTRAARAGHVSRGPRTPAAKRTGRAKVRGGSRVSRAVRPAGKTRPTRPRSTRFVPPDPARVAAVLEILERTFPGADTALAFQTPLQLLVATILSAQCTDARVNMVTPVLFAKYPDAASLAAAPLPDLEEIIRSTGFYRNKAKSIHACTTDIVEKFGGEVPRTLEELVTLHGVGRKTANVVLGNAFGIPGLVVDTHVTRLANRLGLTNETDAVKIEFALQPIVPREKWTRFSHWLILHGRRTCIARKPACSKCPLSDHCPRIGVTVSQ